MGGIKRKIPLMKIEKKDSRAVDFSKRSKGLYSKASELCLLSGGQIATPVSSKSNVSFYSFGHSSIDGVVDAFLTNKRPRDDLGLGFLWADESLARSEDPEEMRDAMNSMSKMLQDLKDLCFDAVEKREDHEEVNKEGVSHANHQKQTLDPQSSSSTICILDDPIANLEGFNKNTEDKILAIYDNNNNNSGLTGNLDGCNQEFFGLDEIFDSMKSKDPSMNLETDDVSMFTLTTQNPVSDSEAVEGGELVRHTDWHENNIHLSDLDENQIISISDNNNALPGNEGWWDQKLDFNQIIDFETNCESLLMNLEKLNDISMMTANQNQFYDYEAVEDGESVIHRDLDEDNLYFSDIFNELTSIIAL